MAGHENNRAVVAALLANLGIAVTKFAAWLLTGASSLLAEAIHSVADSANQGLLLLGARRSQQDATEEHPFGFGRERYIYSFLVAVVLFSLGGLFALYEAYHKWQAVRAGHPDELLESRWWWVPLVVLTAAIAMEGYSLKTAVIESNKVRGKTSWPQFIRASKAPELPVVLMEDSAALLGLAFALAGIGLTLLTGNAYFDVLGAAAIGALLVVVAVLLAVETKSLLLGESATRASIGRMRRALEGTPGVAGVIHLKTLHLGPEELLVAAKIAVDHDDSAASIAATIDAAERRVRAAEPVAQQIYLEPDIYRADYAPDHRPEPPTAPGAH